MDRLESQFEDKINDLEYWISQTEIIKDLEKKVKELEKKVSLLEARKE